MQCHEVVLSKHADRSVLMIEHFLIIFGLVIGINAIIWLFIFKRFGTLKDKLREEAANRGEVVVYGPERVRYMGWNVHYGQAKNLGMMVVTDRRIVFMRLYGKEVDISHDEIESILTESEMMKRYYPKHNKFSVVTRDHGELLFSAGDRDRWVREIGEYVGK